MSERIGSAAESLDIVESLEVDGAWCPVAHCNLFDDSFHDLPPLRAVRHVQSIPDPPSGLISLGAFTGERFAVCVFHGPDHPALVAFDYEDGSVRWASPIEDFPVDGRGRAVSGILLAKLGLQGRPPRRCIFASNPHEFIAYDENGGRIWRQSARDLVPEAADGIGRPRSFSFTADKALVIATSRGWIIKLSPSDGSRLDAYRMNTSVAVNGRLYRGLFDTTLSGVTIGNALYLVVRFEADESDPLPEDASPVFIVRVDLDRPGARGPGTTIMPLAEPSGPADLPPDRIEIATFGLRRFGGSPVGMLSAEGNPIILGGIPAVVHGQVYPAIIAAEDRKGRLTLRWYSLLSFVPGEVITAGPGLYAAGDLYLVPTESGIHIFERVSELSGPAQPARFIPAVELLTIDVRVHAATVNLTSPISTAFDAEANELVGYVNVSVRQSEGGPMFGFMTAFVVPLDSKAAPRPLWTEAVVRDASGGPAVGPGTFGQPALFRYRNGSDMATGLIVNTWGQGTVIFR